MNRDPACPPTRGRARDGAIESPHRVAGALPLWRGAKAACCILLLLGCLQIVSRSLSGEEMPGYGQAEPVSAPTVGGGSFPCDRPGWFPDGFGLKEHTVFWFGDRYYIAATYLGADDYEQRLAYAASPDFCSWTDLGGILTDRQPGAWDEGRIWSPHVYAEDGVYYLFYAGVTQAFAQSIMLATSTDPSDPASWERRGVVFQPTHPGSVWEGFDSWSDCRDPLVIKVDDLYHLYYTGTDVDGGIVGVASAPSPLGPWTDQGAILTTPGVMPENATFAANGGLHYLIYNHSGQNPLGAVYRYSTSLAGPWSDARLLRPGWAHEIWQGRDGKLYTSYLRRPSVHIQVLTWDDFCSPPCPLVGDTRFRQFLPAIVR